MLSRFLLATYDPQQTVALIAGCGRYPILTANAFRAHYIALKLIAFQNETASALIDTFDVADRVILKVGQLGHMLKALKNFKARYALMAGQITPKRLFRGLHPDLKAIRLLASLREKNAETLFGAIATEIERRGVTLLDARSLLDPEIAHAGLIVGKRLKEEQCYIDHGIRIAKEIARLDIGQSVVVRNGTVLAVEAFEGTDAMLSRVAEFKSAHTLFVKASKPNQDYRFDVPVFGRQTLEIMSQVGIGFVALEADRTLILDKQEVLAEARRRKIQIYGYTCDEV